MAEPRVRFKRDDGSSYPAWVQGRFGDLIEVYDEKVTSDSTLPVLTSSKVGGIQYQSDHFGRDQLHDITGYNVIPRGYCTYRNRSDGTDFTFNINNLCDRGIVSKFYPVFHTTPRCNLYFLMTLMNNEPKTVRKIAMAAKGTGQKVLSFLELQKIVINIPSLEEQQKITDFLSSIDEIITTSEAEVANLETQKKAVMKKIFSREVRFKRVDGTDFPDWKEQSFENAFVPLNNNTFSRDMLNNDSGSALNIHYGDILVKYGDVCDIRSDRLPYVNDGINVSKYAYLQDGDIILADTAEDEAVGKAIEIINVGDLIVVSGLHTMACRPKQKFSPRYLGYFMNSPAFHDQLKPYMQGIKVTSIGRKNIKNVSVIYPSCLEEQHHIADFLSSFDKAIAAAKKELELWKELKKGLLQQMFV